jgi:hypothetical protein
MSNVKFAVMKETALEKHEFNRNARRFMQNIFDKLDRIVHKTEKTLRVPHEAKEELAHLKLRRKELKERYESLTVADGEKWDEARTSFARSAVFFNEGLKKVSMLLN